MAKQSMNNKTEDRFWSHVNTSGGVDSCWPWMKRLNHDGYGQFAFKSKPVSAHRMAFLFSGGTIPDDFLVLHKCDNPACCNPKHLFVGTHADNMADKVSKNRQSRIFGEKHPNAKLSNRRVLALKKLRSLGWRQTTLAVFFGISRPHVSDVCSGRRRVQG